MSTEIDIVGLTAALNRVTSSTNAQAVPLLSGAQSMISDAIDGAGDHNIVFTGLPGSQSRADLLAEVNRLGALAAGGSPDAPFPEVAAMKKAIISAAGELDAVVEGQRYSAAIRSQLFSDMADNLATMGAVVAATAAGVGIASLVLPIGIAIALLLLERELR